MKLYKGELTAEATKEQVPLMKKAGWSEEAPKEKKAPKEEAVEETEEEETQKEASTPRTTIRKPIKK